MPARAGEVAGGAPRSLPKGTRLIFAGIVLGTSLAALDTTVVATALPTISSELHGLDHISWIASVYLLTSTVTLPLYGKLGDLLGRQRVLRASILIFLAGSVLSGAARSLGELIAFRAVQGVGAGGLIVLSYALIADMVSPRERGRYQGYVGAVHGAAVIAGPLAGGLLTDHLSWRWVFYINVPVGLLSLLAMSRPIRVPTRRSRIDWTGALVLSGAATTIALVLGRDDPHGVTAAMLITTVAAVAVCGGVLVRVERRAPEPIVPPSLFADRTFRISAGVSFLIGAVQYGALNILPLLIQVMYGASATGSGALLTPLLLALIACGALAGQIASRTGRYKLLPVVGCGLLTASLSIVATIDPGTSRSIIGVAMVAMGAGIGLTIQTFTLATQNSVRPEDMGVATSLVHFARAIGGLVGVALVGSIVTGAVNAAGAGIDASSLSPEELGRLDPGALASLTDHVTHGFATGGLIYAGLMTLGALASLRLEEQPLRTTVAATITASSGS